MASAGDQAVVMNSLNDNVSDSMDIPFSDKNFVYITDTTSNSGVFSNNQINFDLNTLNSQSQWIDLKNCYVEFPVKITAKITNAAAGTPGNSSMSTIAACIKNGWHHFINSAQLILNGQTIQSQQPFENCSSSYRMYSNWSQDTLQKYGKTCGVALDDCSGDTVSTLGNVQLPNSTYSTVATSVIGFDDSSNNASVHNDGISSRMTLMNLDVGTAGNLKNSIIAPTNSIALGSTNCAVASASNTVGTVLYSCCAMATVRIKDLFDINELPLVKNLNGFMYLTLNSSTTTLTGTTAGGAGAITSVSYNIIGQTNPVVLNKSAITFGAGSTNGPTIVVSASVNGSTADLVSGCSPILTTARLVAPVYHANPKTDMALSNSNKMFASLEKIVNPFYVTSGSTTNYTITSGAPNPKRLVLIPLLQNLGGATNLSDPEISAFHSVPGSTGPFALLSQLQVYVANRPMYQYPINYSFEQWIAENSLTGYGSGYEDVVCSGLLTEQLFEQNHQYYTVDLSRRSDSENGATKSVQVSFTNPTKFGMKVIAILFYEKQWVVNTSMCQLQNIK